MNFRNATQTALVEARLRADRRRQRVIGIIAFGLTMVGLAAVTYWTLYVTVAVLKHFGVL